MRDVPGFLVLASCSPRRLELLIGLGFDVEVRAPRADETILSGESASKLVARLAAAKAASVPRTGDERVLAADTVVELAGEVIGKPQDDDHARELLRRLSGCSHRVISGFHVLQGGGARSGVIASEVHFRTLSDLEIDIYVATGEPRDKAGAYGIQGLGGALVASVSGSYTNVVGLPVEAVLETIRGPGGTGSLNHSS